MRGKKGARSVPPQPPPLSGGETVVLRRVEVSTGAVRGAKSEILALAWPLPLGQSGYHP